MSFLVSLVCEVKKLRKLTGRWPNLTQISRWFGCKKSLIQAYIEVFPEFFSLTLDGNLKIKPDWKVKHPKKFQKIFPEILNKKTPKKNSKIEVEEFNVNTSFVRKTLLEDYLFIQARLEKLKNRLKNEDSVNLTKEFEKLVRLKTQLASQLGLTKPKPKTEPKQEDLSNLLPKLKKT